MHVPRPVRTFVYAVLSSADTAHRKEVSSIGAKKKVDERHRTWPEAAFTAEKLALLVAQPVMSTMLVEGK